MSYFRLFFLGFLLCGLTLSLNLIPTLSFSGDAPTLRATLATELSGTNQASLPYFRSFDELKEHLLKIGALYEYEAWSFPWFNNEEDLPMMSSAPIANERADMQVGGNAEPKSTDFSQTNGQVQGLDEGDYIKTDGKYIYYASNQQIAIVETNGAEMQQKSLIQLGSDQNIAEMHLSNQHLVVVSTRWEAGKNQKTSSLARDIWYPETEITAYTVYNLANPAAPQKLRSLELRGKPLATRLAGNTLYFAATQYLSPRLYQEIHPENTLPRFNNITYPEGQAQSQETSVPADKICYFPDAQESSFLQLGSFDITKLDPVEPQTFLGGGEYFYMHPEALFVVCPNWDYSGKSSSQIYKFTVNDLELKYQGNTTVSGSPLNQYSFDYYQENLRIATTDQQGNNLFILGPNLEAKGTLTGLAPGERIYSARFLQDMAYLVTFKQVDPLFAIDLHDPSKPVVLGELKIPGFSEYLHPIGQNLLVGFGRHTQDIFVREDDGTETVINARDNGIKLSLFDISNPRNPLEVDKLVFAGSQTHSEAFNNPRAMLVDAQKQRFAFPITVYETNSASPVVNNWEGGLVISVQPEQKLQVSAQLKIGSLAESAVDSAYLDGPSRLCYIGNTLYLATKGQIHAYDYTQYKLQNTLRISVQ